MLVIVEAGKKPASRRSLLLAATLACCALAQAESRISKCTQADGRVVFTQTGCHSGVREILHLDNPEIGWLEPKSVVEARKRKPTGARRGGSETAEATTKARRAQRERCWRAEKRIDRIDDERKRGYKLARGRELRRQREEWQEYLRRFCD